MRSLRSTCGLLYVPAVALLSLALPATALAHAKRRCQSNEVRRYAARPPSRERQFTPLERATQPRQQSVSACILAS